MPEDCPFTDPHAEIELMGAAYTALAHLDPCGQRRALAWLTASLEAGWRTHDAQTAPAGPGECQASGTATGFGPR